MKKFNTELQFVFSPLFNGIKGGEYVPLEAHNTRLVKTVKTMINLGNLPQTQDMVTLLSDSHITMIFEEECGEMFETMEDVRNAFTFEARRHRGWIDRTSKESIHHPHMFWVALICDQGNKRIEEAAALSSFILTQLVRFGMIDRPLHVPRRQNM